MLCVIVIIFIVTWCPIQILAFYVYLDPLGVGSVNREVFTYIYIGCHWLCTAHGCSNPLIYCFMNKNFRDDLRKMLTKRTRNHRQTMQI